VTGTFVTNRETLRIRIERSLNVASDDTQSPSAKEFSEYFKSALELGVKPARIAHLVGERPKTIHSWANGEEVPGVYRRRLVLRWLKPLLM
jgi:hypothetical protein